MPTNTNWLCFNCRIIMRRAMIAKEVPVCSKCGEKCKLVGHKIRLPRKEDDRDWRMLQERLQQWHQATMDRVFRTRVREQHRLERQIQHLERLPENPGRRALLRELRQKLWGTAESN